MDASQITKLLQMQNTRYLHRSQTVDSSTMIWMNQIQSSKYIKGVATCTGLQNTNVPTEAVCPNGDGTKTFGGGGKQMTLATGSTQQYPSVFRGAAGSASQVYSSDTILLQKAGRAYCAGLISDQDTYTILPTCYENNTNGPTEENPAVNQNPYLPPFDPYYKFKNLAAPKEDQNQKHYVERCKGKVVEPYVPLPLSPWPSLMVGENANSWIMSNSIVYDGDHVYVTGSYSGIIDFYSGGLYPAAKPVLSLSSSSTSSTAAHDAFVAKYTREGALEWIAPIKMRTDAANPGSNSPPIVQGFSVSVDSTGLTVLCGMTQDGAATVTAEFYSGYLIAPSSGLYNPAPGTGIAGSSISGLAVARFNVNGCLQWVNLLDGVAIGQAYADSRSGVYLQLSSNTNPTACSNGAQVYVAASTIGGQACTLYQSSGLALPSFTTSNSQAVLVQYDAITGMIQWITHLDSNVVNATSSGLSVVCNATAVFMAGYFNKSTTFYSPSGDTLGTLQGNATTPDGIYVISYRTNGTFQWVNQSNNTSSNGSYGFGAIKALRLGMDTNGVYLMANFRESLGVAFTAGTALSFTPSDARSLTGSTYSGVNRWVSVALIRYAVTTGTVSWMSKIVDVFNTYNTGATPFYDYGIGIGAFEVVSDGVTVYITGGYLNAISLYDGGATNPGSVVTTLTPLNTTTDFPVTAYVIAYAVGSGSIRWMTKGGQASSTAVGYSLTTHNSRLLVTGWGAGPTDWYQANGRTDPTVVGQTLTSPTSPYSFVVAYDTNGFILP